MTSSTRQITARHNFWRIIGWGSAVALILTPLVAMQFTKEVDWDETDFMFATVIFGIVGGLVELSVRASPNRFFHVGSIFAIFGGFAVIWSNLAVGMIGNEDNPVNLWFGLVLAIAILGAISARFHRGLLRYSMIAAGVVQTAIGLFAGVLGSDYRGGVFTMVLAGIWFVAGLLNWLADRSASPSAE